MGTRVAINGFGRIGRQAFKLALERPELEVVAINDIGDVANLAYLLKYDSVYRRDSHEVKAEDGALVVGSHRYQVLSVTDPADLPWKELEIDLVIEAAGRFKTAEQASAHL